MAQGCKNVAGRGTQAGTQQAQVAAAHAQAVAAVARSTRELRAEKERAEALASQLDSLRAQSATATAAAAEAASAAATELARLEVRGCIAFNFPVCPPGVHPGCLVPDLMQAVGCLQVAHCIAQSASLL
jgi:hypothetical protein